jgi:hypothetical protein
MTQNDFEEMCIHSSKEEWVNFANFLITLIASQNYLKELDGVLFHGALLKSQVKALNKAYIDMERDDYCTNGCKAPEYYDCLECIKSK